MMLQTGLGKYLAPTSMGAGYAIAKILLLRWLNPEEALGQDFLMQFLAGVLIGFSLRPIVKVVYWEKKVGFLMVSLLMLTFGAPGNVLQHFVWGVPMDKGYWSIWGAELVTALVIGVLATVLLLPPKNTIGFGWIIRRIYSDLDSLLLARLLVCSAFYILLFFGLQALLDETMLSVGFTERIQELLALPPLNLQHKIMLVGGQGLCMSLVLWWLCMFFLRGFVEQLVVLGSLAFVLGVFAPAFANFQQIDPMLLVDHVFIGFCRSFLFVAFVVWLLRRSA